MGWGPDAHGSPGRIESAINDLEGTLPCDFLALRDQGINPDRILVPTAGGPSSDLAAEVAQLLQGEYDSRITLLHVADDQETGQQFLKEWATARGLEEAELLVKAGSVENAIKQAAEDCSLVIIGATGRGFLPRVVRGSAVVSAAEEADCSVVLAERPTRRSLRERLFGR